MRAKTISCGVALPARHGDVPARDGTVRASRMTTVRGYGTAHCDVDEARNLPSVTFVVLSREDGTSLDGCLETIGGQEYPEQLVETVVVKGVGSEEAGEVARRFSADVVLSDCEDIPEQINLGIAHTKHDIVFAIGADGGLSRTDWLRLMVRPFVERPDVGGAFTQMVEAPTDGAFARYLCRINSDPFVWFVHGDIANPRCCRGTYGAEGSGKGYETHLFPARRPPLIPADHGVGVRRSALLVADGESGTTSPLIRIIESGQPVALVPAAGVHHQNADGLWPFIKEYHARLRGSPDGWPVCSEQHPAHRSSWRRARKYLFEIYGLTAVMPLLDAVWLSLLEKDSCMLWHGPAAISVSWLLLIENVRRRATGSAARGGSDKARIRR